MLLTARRGFRILAFSSRIRLAHAWSWRLRHAIGSRCCWRNKRERGRIHASLQTTQMAPCMYVRGVVLAVGLIGIGCANPGRTCGAQFGQCAPDGACVAGRCEPNRAPVPKGGKLPQGGEGMRASSAPGSGAGSAMPAVADRASIDAVPLARVMSAERRVAFASSWAVVSATRAIPNPARAQLLANDVVYMRFSLPQLAPGDEVVEAYVLLPRPDAVPLSAIRGSAFSIHAAGVGTRWDAATLEPALPPTIVELRSPRALIAGASAQSWIRVPALALLPGWRAAGDGAGDVALVTSGDGATQVQFAAADGPAAALEWYVVKKIDRKLE
jgi:hypothetical protein